MAPKRRTLFDPKSFLAQVGDGHSVGKYGKGQVVFSQGDTGDAVFYVQKGKVKITVVSEQGKEAVVAILGTDDFFGEGCLAGQMQRISTVTAMTDSVIVRLKKSAVVRAIHEEPAFSEMFIAHLLGRTIRVEADLVDQLFNSSEKRLARMLLLLANFGKDSKPEPIIAKISQETLAEMIGTTRSRVSFFMNKFRELGFIEALASAVLRNAAYVHTIRKRWPCRRRSRLDAIATRYASARFTFCSTVVVLSKAGRYNRTNETTDNVVRRLKHRTVARQHPSHH